MNNKIVQKIFAWGKANSKKTVLGIVFLFVATFIQPWVHVSSHKVMVLDEKTQLPVVGVPVIRQLGGETGYFYSYRGANFYEEYAITDENGMAHFKGVFLKRLFNYFIWNFDKDEIRDATTLGFKYGYYPLHTQHYLHNTITESEKKFKPDWVVMMKSIDLADENAKIDYLQNWDPAYSPVANFAVFAINSCSWEAYKSLLLEMDQYKQEQEKYGFYSAMEGLEGKHWYQVWRYLALKNNREFKCKTSAYDWLDKVRENIERK